jgi:hypothetical protein
VATRGARIAKSSLIALRLAAPLALGGCGCLYCTERPASNIDFSDNSVVIPSINVAVDLKGDSRQGGSAKLRSSHALELGLTGAHGEGHDSLPAGEHPVAFGGTTFTAPQDLRYDFKFSFAQLAYRYRAGLGSGGAEVLAGVGVPSLGLRVSGTTQTAYERLTTPGLVLGLGGFWRFRPSTSLEGRFSLFDSEQNSGVTYAIRRDLRLVHALGRNVSAHIGLSSWNVRSVRDSADWSGDTGGATSSEIRIRFWGPAIGLDFLL